MRVLSSNKASAVMTQSCIEDGLFFIHICIIRPHLSHFVVKKEANRPHCGHVVSPPHPRVFLPFHLTFLSQAVSPHLALCIIAKASLSMHTHIPLIAIRRIHFHS